MSTRQPKNIFLTGASSGIGRATAELLARQNHAVWCTARSIDRLPVHPNLHPLAMDLTDPASIDTAWKQALAEAGHFDVVIQNAGSGMCGSIEEISVDDASTLWRVLVEGPLHVLQLAASHFRVQRRGRIIGVSSLAAELPIAFGAHYSAGKAAFSSLLSGLSMELKPFGVHVVDVRPGDIATPFNDVMPTTIRAESPYLPWLKVAWDRSCELVSGGPPPGLVAKSILAVVEKQDPPTVMRCGTFFQAKVGPFGSRFMRHRWLLDSVRSYFHLDRVDKAQRGK